MVRIFLQAAPQQTPYLDWNLIPLRLLFEHSRERVGDRIPAEELSAREHLVQHNAKRPDVRSPIDRFSSRLLGTDVRGRA